MRGFCMGALSLGIGCGLRGLSAISWKLGVVSHGFYT